jgi:hypothetical protein
MLFTLNKTIENLSEYIFDLVYSLAFFDQRIMSSSFQQLSDEQWFLILSLMDLHLPPERGVPRRDLRKVWNSLLFVLTRG